MSIFTLFYSYEDLVDKLNFNEVIPLIKSYINQHPNWLKENNPRDRITNKNFYKYIKNTLDIAIFMKKVFKDLNNTTPVYQELYNFMKIKLFLEENS